MGAQTGPVGSASSSGVDAQRQGSTVGEEQGSSDISEGDVSGPEGGHIAYRVVCQEVANSCLSAAEPGLRDEQGVPAPMLKIEGDWGKAALLPRKDGEHLGRAIMYRKQGR